jgi:hypothetical protein
VLPPSSELKCSLQVHLQLPRWGHQASTNQSTRRLNPKGHHNPHCRENLKSHKFFTVFLELFRCARRININVDDIKGRLKRGDSSEAHCAVWDIRNSLLLIIPSLSLKCSSLLCVPQAHTNVTFTETHFQFI